MRLAICALSECSDTVTPASIRTRTLYFVASYASILNPPQSLQTAAATPEAASSEAILYASTPCWIVWTLNPNSSARSEEHTSELQSQSNLVCRLLLEKKYT